MEITKNSVGEDYEFVPKESMVSENKWSFEQICHSFGSKIINDSPTYQRPDVAGSNLLYGEGTIWQKNLMKDIILQNPIQPLHFRVLKKNKDIIPGVVVAITDYEIVDGGHRTRTIYKFFHNYVRLPKGTILTDINGNDIDISNYTYKDILQHYPSIAEYIRNLTFTVYEYNNLSDKGAEELFLKLNDLHKMTPADKRNAINGVTADTCRKYGAADSKNGLEIFTTFSQKGQKQTLQYVSIPMIGRATDEMVSFALYYLYKGGVNSNDFKGMDSQSVLNDMYRDEKLTKRLSDSNDSLLSDLDSLLKIVNAVVKNGRVDNSKGGAWGKGSLKKLFMLIAESARNAGGFGKYKPDAKKLYNELKEAYTQLTKSSIAHHPFQLYEVVGGNVVPLSDDKQPKNITKSETYQFRSVFIGGARVDDLLYIYHHFMTKGVFKFGLKTTTKDDSRTFNDKQIEAMRVEQTGICKKCKCDFSENKYAADHILPHSYGGPTVIKNGQLLCVSCNERKSCGMDINDVEYLCKKYNYLDYNNLKKYIIRKNITMDEDQIKRIKEIVIDGKE
jgi:hypothetical protein